MEVLSQQILELLKKSVPLSSKEIFDAATLPVSYATLKRKLQQLAGSQMITTSGKGKATKYIINSNYAIIAPVNLDNYFLKETDERKINTRFNFLLITQILPRVTIFTANELQQLNQLQQQYVNNIARLSPTAYKKELNRLAIDLSWKSSQIEGNTYSLLETERLLNEKETAAGKTKDEAVMLLNHKEALDFIIDHPDFLQPLSIPNIENIHRLLVKELGIERNIRNQRVGISGTNYKPLENAYQIKEALESMCVLINSKQNVFEKALLALLLLSYIQPFTDGNKRTARIVSNALLLLHHYCPVSFRTVNSIDYKKAMLIFYEQNNITAFKKIFIEQFEFAVGNYF